jgi:hypothetical protein
MENPVKNLAPKPKTVRLKAEAEALRANLAKRKEQARKRQTQNDTPKELSEPDERRKPCP